tara:strand:+ start:6924 stop:8357 length:1434 start_codon:yes stop_codon:yes gene_type:complete
LSLRSLFAKHVIDEDFFKRKNIDSFQLSIQHLSIQKRRFIAKQLKPACIDYRSHLVVDQKYAVPYVLAEECRKRNDIYLNDKNWQRFCDEFNLPIDKRPKHEELINVHYWHDKLTRLLQQAKNLHKHYMDEGIFNMIHEDTYQQLLHKRKRKFSKIDNVRYDLDFSSRKTDVSYYLAEVTGLNKLAFTQSEMELIHVTIRLPEKFHKSSPKYEYISPAIAAKALHDLIDSYLRNKLTRHADKTGIQTYYVRVTETHKDGTPHLHILFWYHDEEYLREVLEQQYIESFGSIDSKSIVIRNRTHSPKRAIRYLLKTLWGKPFDLTREEAWRKTHGIRCYSSASLSIKKPNKSTWEKARKSELSRDINQAMIDAAIEGDYASFFKAYSRLNNRVHREHTFKYTLENLYFSVKRNLKCFFRHNSQLNNKVKIQFPLFERLKLAVKTVVMKIIKPDLPNKLWSAVQSSIRNGFRDINAKYRL